MEVYSSGEVYSDNGNGWMQYFPKNNTVEIGGGDSANYGSAKISYKEFLEMANEIIRQKENHDAT